MVTINELVKFAIIIMSVWGFIKIVMEIVKAITSRHDREQEWDNGTKERKQITEQFNNRLDVLEKKVNDNYEDTKAELYILTKCMRAVLDGLHQQGCNGEVTVASQKLDDYLVQKAHERGDDRW